MKFREALSYFTRIPVGTVPALDNYKGFLIWFPFVGLIIGAIVAFVMGVVSIFVPSFFCAIIGSLVWLMLTGGQHIKEIVNCGDVACCIKSMEEKHGISQNSRVGTSGMIFAFFVLAVKTAALAMIVDAFDIGYSYSALIHFVFICMGVAAFARCVTVLATYFIPSAKKGLAYEFTKPLIGYDYAIVTIFAFIIAYFSGSSACFMTVSCILLVLFMRCFSQKYFGGLTSDSMGFITEVSEALVLVAFALSL